MPKLCPVCGTTFSDANVFCPKDGSTLRAAELDSDLIGTVVADRYLVTDLLGEGGMGKVYLARHVRLPQQAAIKVLRPAMLRDPAAVARFNREAANASSIEHEHIARVFDYGESSDGTVYLAMEYVPGRTLKKILATDGPQSPERTARLARQIGDALDAAHKMGIVHRDLKPDNVMVVESADSGDKCKVVDFGIAKAVGGDAGEAGLTKTGFVVGTPEFMSPEQLMGSTIDHRSDVYALALLTFQCLTGVLPFDSSTPERAMTARLIEPPETLARVRSDVSWPRSLQAVLDRGLAKDPANRYDSAGQFARELQQAVATWGGDTTVGEPAVRPSLVVTAPAGQAAGPTAGPAAGPATGPAAGAAVPAEPRANTRAVQPARSASPTHVEHPTVTPSRSRLPMWAGGAVAALALVAVAWALTANREPAEVALASGDTGAVVNTVPPVPSDVETGGAVTVPVAVPPERPATETPQIARINEPAQRQTKGSEPQLIRPGIQTDLATVAPGRPRETSAAAKFTLDSLRIALNPATATETDARRAIAALRGLMPRLATAEDSAWGYLRLAEAHFLSVDEVSACVALKAARPLLRDATQQKLFGTMSAVITVSC